jgi:hypothetical protein
MTQQDALNYCYQHKNEYVSDLRDLFTYTEEDFLNLTNRVRRGEIKPHKIKDFGMDY